MNQQRLRIMSRALMPTAQPNGPRRVRPCLPTSPFIVGTQQAEVHTTDSHHATTASSQHPSTLAKQPFRYPGIQEQP
jgi:hypothetical protein